MSRITLLDGGMGQELIKRSPGGPTALWSARVMMDDPELVKDVHLDYIRAGARVITVNAYSATRDRLEPPGFGDRFEELQRRACELALRARDESGEEVAIAGCLPPLMWSYRPDLAGSSDQTAAIYAEIARLQAPHVDLILCETMSSADQGLGAVRGALAGGGGKPVWVAWTLRDDDSGRLRSGETLAEAAAVLDGLPVAARLLNCSISCRFASLAFLNYSSMRMPRFSRSRCFRNSRSRWSILRSTRPNSASAAFRFRCCPSATSSLTRAGSLNSPRYSRIARSSLGAECPL